MKVNQKLKVFRVMSGQCTKVLPNEFPDEFERMVLKRYVKTGGASLAGCAISGTSDFIVWLGEKEHVTMNDVLPKKEMSAYLNEACLALMENEKHWFEVLFSLEFEVDVGRGSINKIEKKEEVKCLD